MDNQLYARLHQVWPEDWERVYFELLENLFPTVVNGLSYDVSRMPIDEAGLHMYRRKDRGLHPSLCLVLHQIDNWALVATTDWMKTHKKMTPPIWMRLEDLPCRVFRNDLFVELLHRKKGVSGL
jgi:hypothetical protein